MSKCKGLFVLASHSGGVLGNTPSCFMQASQLKLEYFPTSVMTHWAWKNFTFKSPTKINLCSVLSYCTYVLHLFEANQGYSTKMNIQPKARRESTGHKGSKRTSPSHQIYLLSGHAKRVATALRNVFKSDTVKEESSKSKEQGQSSKYLSVDPMRTNLETVSVAHKKNVFLICYL